MAIGEGAEIKDFIERYFNLAKTKNIESIEEFIVSNFHKFGETSPYERRERERALMLEQLQFTSVSDFDFKIDDFQVDIIDRVALVTFLFESSAMVVDDYSFRGEIVKSRSRVTVVLVKDSGSWKMLHQHLSRFQS